MSKLKEIDMEKDKDNEIRPDVITVEDVTTMVPKLKGHEKLVEKALHWLQIDEVNRVHGAWCSTPGPEFSRHLIEDEFKTPLRVDNEDILAEFPEGAFITVSNHPFGSLDGIALINLVTRYRPKYKVMVNMILGRLSAMRENFITVDAWQSDDPEKRKVSVNGIRQALRQLKEGQPVGFFPAGAMSKTDRHNFLVDRPWQKSVLEIIARAKVPVIPIYFHGNNRWFFNLMGHICWPLRSLLLPRELFSKKGKEIHISIGQPISPEEQLKFKGDVEGLGKYLREKTYELSSMK
ncbi:MAG: lysophospholipid acyltransferase family protein [Muribaculaceae bacterium]|nr:lysophospholipid acyltransferase family protein [Muribaculaceae bacterium]